MLISMGAEGRSRGAVAPPKFWQKIYEERELLWHFTYTVIVQILRVLYPLLFTSWLGSRGSNCSPKVWEKNLLWVCSPKVLEKDIWGKKNVMTFYSFLYSFQNFLNNFKIFHYFLKISWIFYNFSKFEFFLNITSKSLTFSQKYLKINKTDSNFLNCIKYYNKF